MVILVTICRVCSVLPKAEALADHRIADEFLKVLKYIACSCKDWNAVMAYFFGAFRDVNGSQKTFKRLYQVFCPAFVKKGFHKGNNLYEEFVTIRVLDR